MASDASGIDYDPRGSLHGTGRWYAHNDVWFEIDAIAWAGGTQFAIFRCYPIEVGTPGESWDSELCGSCETYQGAVAAIEGMIAEETGDGQSISG